MKRRTRQSMLFLVAVVLPATALSILTYRFLGQGEELAKQREPEQRREAVDQAQRELATSLDKIRLQEINRRVTAGNRPADAAIVLSTVLDGKRLVLPWETHKRDAFPSPGFSSNLENGEIQEFQTKDFAKAAASYRLALAGARQPEEACDARLNLARILVKGGKPEEAVQNYREILGTCNSVRDDQGMPFPFYAAERLVTLKLDIPFAENFLVRQVHDVHFVEPPQMAMIRATLASIRSEAAERTLIETDQQIKDYRQALTLEQEFEQVRPLAEKQWVAYGEEPWLIKLTPAPPLPPTLFVISSRKVAPPGTTLTTAKTARSYTLGQGFSGLEIELDPSRSFSANRPPAGLIAGGVGSILALTILSGYLLLRGVNRDLQMAELRSHFVASVSHELKTPLTAIRMFAETLVLGRTHDETARTEYLETIMNESERLARLVDNVLDFSKIEQGKKIYRMRPTMLPEVVRSAARAMHYPLSQQGFDLSVSIDEEVPPLAADEDALEQAILNLLSNAMKYSRDSRQIELHCVRNKGDAVIAVKDHGIGIAVDDQQRIFEKFYRIRTPETDLIAGTGLGLTLVKHIAAAHKGFVDVESAPGQGSTFSIRIPVSSEASA